MVCVLIDRPLQFYRFQLLGLNWERGYIDRFPLYSSDNSFILKLFWTDITIHETLLYVDRLKSINRSSTHECTKSSPQPFTKDISRSILCKTRDIRYSKDNVEEWRRERLPVVVLQVLTRTDIRSL